MKSSSSRTLSDILTIVWRLRILVLLQRSHNLPLRFDVILYLRNFLTSNNENLQPIAGDESKTLKFIQLTFLTFSFLTQLSQLARPNSGEAAERTFKIYSVSILVFSARQITQGKSAEIVNLLGFFSQC